MFPRPEQVDRFGYQTSNLLAKHRIHVSKVRRRWTHGFIDVCVCLGQRAFWERATGCLEEGTSLVWKARVCAYYPQPLSHFSFLFSPSTCLPLRYTSIPVTSSYQLTRHRRTHHLVLAWLSKPYHFLS